MILRELVKWAEFVKISHTVFALPFAIAAMVVAARPNRGWPGSRVFLLILGAMVAARTCAMTFNRIVDREFDRANPRTAGRHLPAGQIRVTSAWVLWAVSALAFVAAAFALNPLCFYLSPVALVVICGYSLAKRFTDYTHVFLGVALALAPVGAWLAVRGQFNWWPPGDSAWQPIILAIAVVFWLVGFDIIYALQDYEFDRTHGLGSLVVRWGPRNALQASFLAHMLMWGVLVAFGLISRFRVAYFVGLVLILASLLLEHWLARRRTQRWIQPAFFQLNAVISVVFAAVVVVEVAFPGFRVTR